MNLLQMSFAGAVMILAVIVIRSLLINRLPKTTFLVLWGIVLARLSIPFSLPSVFSVYSLLDRSTPADAAINTQVAHILAVTPVRQDEALTSAPELIQTVSIWNIVWVIGVLACALFFTIAYLKCHWEFQISLPVENDFAKSWLNTHRLHRHIYIRQSSRFSAPLTYGVFRPVILMPKATKWEDTTALQYVLAHEYVHIRRFDTLIKLVLIATLSVHWFNPLVWAMYILANRDLELSCDEKVVLLFGEQAKSTYARTLISMEETRSRVMPLCNNFSKNAIEERITAVMKTRKTTIVSFVLAVTLVAGTITVFATSAQAGTGGTNEPQEKQSTNEGLDQTATINGVLTSYVDDDGQLHYIVDDDNGTKTLSQKEFDQQYPVSDVEWWTYEEYKNWLENEKLQLQNIIGESAWTSGRGDFIWTQAMVDETIAEYEKILQGIKDGMMYSKTVDGETNIMVGYDPSVTSTAYGNQLFIQLDNGDERYFGPYETATELLAVVKPFCEEQVELGNMKESEAQEIISRYTER
ncbi:MAG: M56 family metallopeptidase [Acutalibacteraceae bacterium]|jgi:beta-lactamase regulating signal transducer with metallopeptidase domain